MKENKLPTVYQQFIHMSRYSRYDAELGRRETWEETVSRFIEFFKGHATNLPDSDLTADHKIWRQLYLAILNLEIMPSMRCMMTAGPALEKDHVAAYNCAFIVMDRPNKFSELMYTLMCGTGVGFSVERQFIANLPEISEEFYDSDTVLVVRDSRAGWCKSLKELISLLYAGQVPSWDLSQIRPEGAPLKTFGGRASGPEPLNDLFKYAVNLFRNRQSEARRLTSLEVHDLCCKIADIVVVGGVRRSALLSLSNLSDPRMRDCKSGEFYHQYPHRTLANNSVAYTEKPDMGIFLQEWLSLYQSKSGERGLFNRAGLTHPERRDGDQVIGTNPCSEILLRDRQFCNLTEVVLRPTDQYGDVRRKVRLATVLGTLQATLTNFRFLSKKWKMNCEEERLLGVSMTGITDSTLSPQDYATAKQEVLSTNEKWAKILGISPATAATCVKPSGTVSQLVNSSSGIHPRFSPYYIRRVRNDLKDPLTQHMIDRGVPWETDVTNPKAVVFSFPMQSPPGCVTAGHMTAIEQLEHWHMVDTTWCEHKASVTIYVKEHEWLEVGAWVYEHFDVLSGVSFMPYSDHVYPQAPYEEITEAEFEKLDTAMPDSIDWDIAESEDNTTSSQEFACVGDKCDL